MTIRYALKKYWWLILLAIAVLVLKFFPEKLPFVEKIVTSQPESTQTTVDDGSPVISVSNFPEWVAQELSILKSGVTLAEWKKNHPDEEVVLPGSGVRIGINIDTTWCAKTNVTVKLSSGQAAVRHVVFYPPMPPTSYAFPANTEIEGNFIENGCTMGLIWIQQSERNESDGSQTAIRIRNAIDNRLGKGQADILLNRVDAKYLRQTGRWQVDEAVFVSAYDVFMSGDKNIFAIGFLPFAGFRDGMQDWFRFNDSDREDQKLRIREAIKTANIFEQDGEIMLSYFPAEGGLPTLQPEQSELLMRFVERWITAAEKLDKTRKAGALIAADQVLSQMQNSIGATSIEKGQLYRQRLKKLGAEFVESGLEKAFFYTHSWLKQALTLDKEGPMGDLAFRIIMNNDCKEGSMEVEDVIKQGEAYLNSDHDSKAKAEVELMVADAYRDIVALASGAGAYNEHPEAYKEMAVEAREKAVRHYKNSLSLLKPSPVAQEAWREAWRLIVGLPAAHLRYYCVYD